MVLSSRRRHGSFQYQVFAHSQAQGAHYLFLGSPVRKLPYRIREGEEWSVQKQRPKGLGLQLLLQGTQLLGQLPAVGSVDVLPEAAQ